MPKVLCIEDEQDFREDLAMILRTEGYDTVEASNGQDGLKLLEKERPDLVLCDINMPGLSGYDVLRQLRASMNDTASVPFVFLTAMGQKSDKIKGLNLSADDYLVKPMDFDVLLSSIRAKLLRSGSFGHAEVGVDPAEADHSATQTDAPHTVSVPMNQMQYMRYELGHVIELTDLLAGERFGVLPNREYIDLGRNIQMRAIEILGAIDQHVGLNTIHEPANEVHLQECWYTAKDLIEESLQACGVIPAIVERRYTVDIAPDIPRLWVDRTYMVQAIKNLITEMTQHVSIGKSLDIRVLFHFKGCVCILINAPSGPKESLGWVHFSRYICTLHGIKLTTDKIHKEWVAMIEIPGRRLERP